MWARTLADGSKAVGIFNRSNTVQVVHLDLQRAGFAKGAKARDLWLRKDLGRLDVNYAPTVAAHGVLFLKVSQ